MKETNHQTDQPTDQPVITCNIIKIMRVAATQNYLKALNKQRGYKHY